MLKEVNPNEVVFEVKENTGYSGRNALLTISNGVETEAFNINQSGAVFIFGKEITTSAIIGVAQSKYSCIVP